MKPNHNVAKWLPGKQFVFQCALYSVITCLSHSQTTFSASTNYNRKSACSRNETICLAGTCEFLLAN